MTARTPLLYLAPWVDFGGTDKGTIDWFRRMDRSRFELYLITTQPSPNRRLCEVAPFAEEVWALPELMSGAAGARFVLDFIASRGIGVVHMMNSRLGFELLPDIRGLARRPRVVVQLHVEEPDAGGYVRYVTTRFDSLVDAYSVVGEHLVETVAGYGVGRDRIHVIPLGVDAEREFSPDRVAPHDGIRTGAGLTNVLFAGRLVAQKDPLLMVEVADALRSRCTDFRLHVVGEGDLEGEVRSQIAARGLERWVSLHPMTGDIRRWYATCDVLLMTSEFEGMPLALYEAMAMGCACVVPALPGNRELAAPGTAGLVDPRDDVDAYVAALGAAIEDPDERRSQGQRARAHVRERFALATMADAHAELYAQLLDASPRPAPAPEAPPPAEAPPTAPGPALRSRPSRGTPRVSVVIPCFNQAAWLRECLGSVRAQTYPDLETVVVDDASTDPDTIAALEELQRDSEVRVLRQPCNAGPSAARNRGIEVATGRYVLPVDSDNLLLPRAVELMVAQLQAAGERIGYIYQSLQYFGNREDYFEAPEFNLHTLLGGNYIDTCSLIDRDVLDGARFPEDVEGHEDWDFFLSLAEKGIHGEPARRTSLLCRKHGFTRSDRIAHTLAATERDPTRRHPRLYGDAGLKAAWSPALSLVAMTPLRAGTPAAVALPGILARQRCADFELVLEADHDVEMPRGSAVRRLPTGRGASPAQRLQEGLRRARGRWLLITRGTGTEPLANVALVEQLIRLMLEEESPQAVAFADRGGHDLRPLRDEELADASAHALAWKAPPEPDWCNGLRLPPGGELDAMARELTLSAERVEWRQLRAPREAEPPPDFKPLRLALERRGDVHRDRERAERLATQPHMPRASVDRLDDHPEHLWSPVLTANLCRHREALGEERLLTTSMKPPTGYVLEHVLGFLHQQALEGTARLALGAGGEIEVHPRGRTVDRGGWARTLGYLEAVQFSGLEPALRGRHPGTGQPVLVCGDDDPLRSTLAGPVDCIGHLERAPLAPARPTAGASLPRLEGLVRATDFAARRHRYAVGAVPDGSCVWELGALLADPIEGAVPLLLDGDRAVQPGSARRAGPLATARWAFAPATWRGFERSPARGRAVLRRATLIPRQSLAGDPESRGAPAGWLLPEAGRRRLALYAAMHRVTGDRLLTRYRAEATEAGYDEPVLLGYMIDRAMQTSGLARPATSIPWASRFGERIRWQLEAEAIA